MDPNKDKPQGNVPTTVTPTITPPTPGTLPPPVDTSYGANLPPVSTGADHVDVDNTSSMSNANAGETGPVSEGATPGGNIDNSTVTTVGNTSNTQNQNTSTGSTGTTTDTTQDPGNDPDPDPTLPFEDWINQKNQTESEIRDDTVNFLDEQAKKMLEQIEKERKAELENAERNRQILLQLSEDEKNAVYAFAEAAKIEDLAYAAAVYQMMVDAINAERESGMKMAGEVRQLFYSMSEELRNKVYETAEKQRSEAETRADIERERGVVDARSSYAQNLAAYGANAEAMGEMGLAGGGYSDYINSKAYATQRAETQAANARAQAVKREARYTEDQAKLQADTDYIKNKFSADKEYLDSVHDIDTTYNKNLLAANMDKTTAEHEAEQEERESKFDADLTYGRNVADVETGYNDSVTEINTQADSDSFNTTQAAEAGKFDADMTYKTNVLENQGELVEYNLSKEEEKASKAEEEASYATAAFVDLLAGANTGAYTAEQLEQLSKEYGLSDEQKQTLINAANEYTTKSQAASNAGISEAIGDTVGAIQAAADAGSISQEEADAKIAKIQETNYNGYMEAVSYGTEYVNTIEIDNAFKNKEISAAQYNQLKSEWNKKFDTSPSQYKDDNGNYYTKDEAKKHMNDILNNSWASDTVKSTIKKLFNAIYEPHVVQGFYYGGLGKDYEGSSGDDFTVKLKANENGNTYPEYHVEIDTRIGNQRIIDVASDVGVDSLFGYDKQIYMKIRDKSGAIVIYRIRQQDADDWDELYSAFFGD